MTQLQELLNSTQKKFLRKKAHSLKVLNKIGKNGLSKSVVENLSLLASKHELFKVKISVDKESKEALLLDIRTKLKCELVGSIGKVVTLYKESSKQVYKSELSRLDD